MAATPTAPAAETHVPTHHDDAVHDSQFDYYGRFLATASSDRAVKVFAVPPPGAAGATAAPEAPRHLATLMGHEGPVWMVAWAHPKFGAALASCSYDQRAIVWKGPAECSGAANVAAPPTAPTPLSANGWKPVHIVTSHSSSVNAVAWAPLEFGLAIATAGSDGEVFVSTCSDGVWQPGASVATQAATDVAHPLGAMAVSWSPMGPTHRRALLASGGGDAAVKLWAPASSGGAFGGAGWKLVHSFTDHKDWVRDVAFAPDTAAPYVTLASCGQDKSVIIRRAALPDDSDSADVDDDDLVWETAPPVTFSEVVWRLSWSPCGTMLLATTADSQAFVLKPGATFTDEWMRAPVAPGADAAAAVASASLEAKSD